METRICLVDDDDVIRDSMQALLRSRRLRLSVFGDPERFFSIWMTSELREVPATFVIDVRMPGLSGLELFARMKAQGLPEHNAVVFLTGHGDISMAVDAMRCGAYDFVEKPFSDNQLVDRIIGSMRHVEHVYSSCSRAAACAALLSPREKEVADLVRQGLTNKEIAGRIHIATRTVEVHRSRIFEKLEVRNAVELALTLQGTQQVGAHGGEVSVPIRSADSQALRQSTSGVGTPSSQTG